MSHTKTLFTEWLYTTHVERAVWMILRKPTHLVTFIIIIIIIIVNNNIVMLVV